MTEHGILEQSRKQVYEEREKEYRRMDRMETEDEQPRSPPTFLGRRLPPMDAEMPFNPFINSTTGSSNYDLVKTILLLPLFILRFFIFTLLLLLGLLFTRLILLGACNVLTSPLPRWRKKLLWTVRYLARCMLFVCGYHWVGIKGKPVHRSKAPVLVCNHVTFVDPIFIFYKHLPVIVTAEDNLNFPLIGSIISAMQPVTLKRESAESRQRAAGEIRRRAKSADSWSSIMIFPEATTTNGRAMVSFKAGAFSSSTPVQPMVVRYPHVHLDPSWVALGPPLHKLLFRLMTQFHNHMEIEYLPVMTPTKQETKNPKVFAERVRAAMAKALNVSVTEHTFDDISMAEESRRANSRIDLLEFGRFATLYKLTPKEARRFFRKFRLVDVSKTGMVTLEQLVDHLELPECDAVRRLYGLFDARGCGYFNFRQYTAALLLIIRHPRIREATEAVYRFFDENENGAMSAAEFYLGLSRLVPGTGSEQARVLWSRINASQRRLVYRVEMLTFLERNPEYVAAFLFARPGLLSNVKADISDPSELKDDG